MVYKLNIFTYIMLILLTIKVLGDTLTYSLIVSVYFISKVQVVIIVIIKENYRLRVLVVDISSGSIIIAITVSIRGNNNCINLLSTYKLCYINYIA